MHDHTVPLAGRLLTVDQELEREFEARLVESSTLAFRVAYSVLRQRQDAEDVAQEAFVKAYRSFSQLRDRDRFRAWLVRMTWRLALDRRRSDRRRVEREQTGGPGSATGAQAARVAEGFTPPALEAIAAGERSGQLWRDRRLTGSSASSWCSRTSKSGTSAPSRSCSACRRAR